jgi:F-type H+-transporting ATPase subunit gamma
MTERLADITARIQGIHQLGSVVNAMRGIAAARAQQARTQLAAVDSYAAIIAAAIGEVLALMPPQPRGATATPGRLALVLFCAEQGFAGAFSERVLDSVGDALTTSELFLIGTRGAMVAAERDITPGWTSAMPSHSRGIAKLADGVAQALYARIATGDIDELDVVFCQWQQGHGTEVQRRRLFPFDLTVFPLPTRPTQPLLNLPPETLLASLTADYMHAQLCRAALHAFSAENEARMEAMASAHSQIDQRILSLQAQERRVRQQEITEEVIELAAGETASRDHMA